MRFSLGFTTCLALVAWVYFGGSSDTLRKLGVDVSSFSQVDGLDGTIEDSSSKESESVPTPESAKPSTPESARETQPEAARPSTPVDPNNLKAVAPEDASRLMQVESMKLMLDANRALAAKAADLERREREIAEREASSARNDAAEAEPQPKATKRRKQEQQEEVAPPPPAPQPEPPVLVEAPATPVYYQCCGCCNCCSCGCHQQTYVVTRRVGLVGRLFGRR